MQRFLPLLAFFCSLSAVAGTHPVNFSLIPDVAVHGRNERIEGFTLSIWGENEQASFALGIVNGMKGNSSGFALGFVNYADNYLGAQVSAVNFNQGTMTGFQWGFFNYAKTMKGLQLGVVNFAETMTSGIQIGLVNVITQTKSWFGEFPKAVAPFMVLANWRFH